MKKCIIKVEKVSTMVKLFSFYVSFAGVLAEHSG